MKFLLFLSFVTTSSSFTMFATSFFSAGCAVAFGLLAIVCGIDSVLEKYNKGL